MGLGKKDIIKKISSKTPIPNSLSKKFLSTFLNILKINFKKDIKISNFGSFTNKLSPRRIGRNPKTKEEFVIPARQRVTFKASSTVKELLN